MKNAHRCPTAEGQVCSEPCGLYSGPRAQTCQQFPFEGRDPPVVRVADFGRDSRAVRMPSERNPGATCTSAQKLFAIQQSDMFFHLGFKLQIAKLAAKRTTHPLAHLPEPSRDHYLWPSSRNTRPITPEIRSQSSVSFANCFRPLFVME